MYESNDIKKQIEEGKIDTALCTLDRLLSQDATNDVLYYLKGNAYRKKGNWQLAMENYLEAIDINPNSPAAEAFAMLEDIMNFYNKDMYNQ